MADLDVGRDGLAAEAYRSGRNVAAVLREARGVPANTPEIIETVYDLQAGTYIAWAEDNAEFVAAMGRQFAEVLAPHLAPGDVLLDVGSGELTNLSATVKRLTIEVRQVIACDISSKRLGLGRAYAERHMGPAAANLRTIHCDMAAIPLPDRSADIVTSSHSLEPNGGREGVILAELLRVARRKLVLFEPCYELADAAGRARMRQHGYIRDLDGAARRLGATIESVTPIPFIHEPLNPTACYVITPSHSAFARGASSTIEM